MSGDGISAHELITEIEQVRRRSRARASVMWFPLLLFGVLLIVSAGVIVKFGGAALGPYWMVAGPAGGVATAVVAIRRGKRVGAMVPGGPYVAVALLILVGAAVTGGLGDALGNYAVSAAGPPLVVSLGYLLFALIERSRALVWVATGLAALTLALFFAGVEPEPMAITLALTFGVVFVTIGLILLGQRRDASGS